MAESSLIRDEQAEAAVLAAQQLRALLAVPGALRIITNEHRCGAPTPTSDEDQARCQAHRYPLSSPRHFVIHTVTRLDDPNDRGLMTAHSAEGDWCRGEPDALLRRLTEAGRVI